MTVFSPHYSYSHKCYFLDWLLSLTSSVVEFHNGYNFCMYVTVKKGILW